jgi:hypothetical protein
MSLSSVEVWAAYDADMSSTSPGPGWWLASDGKWYPQKWEYTFRSQQFANNEELLREADSLGQQGWELVNVMTMGHPIAVSAAWFKRPLAP